MRLPEEALDARRQDRGWLDAQQRHLTLGPRVARRGAQPDPCEASASDVRLDHLSVQPSGKSRPYT